MPKDTRKQPPTAASGVPPVVLSRSDRNHYAVSGLDRMSVARKDADAIGARMTASNSWLVPVWRSRNLIDPGDPPEVPPKAVLLRADEGAELLKLSEETVLLGEADGQTYFAVDLSAVEDTTGIPALRDPDLLRAEFLDLRFVGPHLDRRDGNMLAYARGMLTWHRRHKYCGSCGSPTDVREAGHVRVCPKEDCGQTQFPRTDPAVIMLVTLGDECLLGRAGRFPPGMYSTLAGFVEPGETLEAAVAREVHEEAGVRVKDVRYHSSQPWPFPTSLMLGFYATALDKTLTVDHDELEDALWASKDWIRENNGTETFRLPRRDSIARRLIEDWLGEG